MPVDYKYLSEEQREHFLTHGWVKIAGGIPPENVESFVGNVWVRLGWDKDDKSTWEAPSVHMPRHREILTKDFCPEAYAAMCDLVGGEERLDDRLFTKSGDGLILNFGEPDQENGTEDPRYLKDCIDGDWFDHFLDSGDQALTVLHLYTDVDPNGCGATMICEDGIKDMAEYLYKNPQGTNMRDGNGGNAYEAIKKCSKFTELHGKAGDVFLAHGFMPHSRTANFKRVFRAIANPPCTLREPLNLNRADPGEYSLLEQKILRDLGRDSIPEWKHTAPHRRFPPFTAPGKMSRVEGELERMKVHAAKTGEAVESIHLHEHPSEEFWLINYDNEELSDTLPVKSAPAIQVSA